MERYFQEEIERAPLEKIREWQNEKFLRQVKHVWDNVEYYRNKMQEAGVSLDDIKSLDDIGKMPFLTKADLKAAYPYGLLAVPLKDCVRIQSTSGTTGKRVVAFYTQEDIDMWNECTARAIVAAGGTNEDVVQVSYGYGLFTGGPGLDVDDPDQLRQYRAADHVHHGFERDDPLLHAELCGLHRRDHEGDGL